MNSHSVERPLVIDPATGIPFPVCYETMFERILITDTRNKILFRECMNAGNSAHHAMGQLLEGPCTPIALAFFDNFLNPVVETAYSQAARLVRINTNNNRQLTHYI